MPTPNELKVIFEKWAAGTVTDEDIEILHQAYEGNEKISFQYGKFVVNIGKGEGINIGDHIYQYTDAEAIKEALRLVVQEKQKAERPREERKLLNDIKTEVKGALKKKLQNFVPINIRMELQQNLVADEDERKHYYHISKKNCLMKIKIY